MSDMPFVYVTSVCLHTVAVSIAVAEAHPAYCINLGKRQCPRVLAQRVNAPGVARVGAPVLLTLSADVPGSYGPALFTSAILFLSTVYLLILKPPGPPP